MRSILPITPARRALSRPMARSLRMRLIGIACSAAIGALISLGGCGQRGPLYHPEDRPVSVKKRDRNTSEPARDATPDAPAPIRQ